MSSLLMGTWTDHVIITHGGHAIRGGRGSWDKPSFSYRGPGGSSKRQQPHRPWVSTANQHQRPDLHQRPLLTFLPLVRIEEVIPLSSMERPGVTALAI